MCSPVMRRGRVLCPSVLYQFIPLTWLSAVPGASPSRQAWARRAGTQPTRSPLSLQRLQSGTTGVCALIVGKTLHIAWLGDSQVILVQQGQVVKLMEPHRPERQVSPLCLSLGHPQPPVTLHNSSWSDG